MISLMGWLEILFVLLKIFTAISVLVATITAITNLTNFFLRKILNKTTGKPYRKKGTLSVPRNKDFKSEKIKKKRKKKKKRKSKNKKTDDNAIDSIPKEECFDHPVYDNDVSEDEILMYEDDNAEIYLLIDDSPKLNLTITGPQRISRNSKFLLDVWAFDLEDWEVVEKFSKSTGRDSVKGMAMGLKADLGTYLQIELSIPHLVVEDALGVVFWDGNPASTSFSVLVPKEVELGKYNGTAMIKINGICFTKLLFTIEVCQNPESINEQFTIQREFFKSAFASYASENRADVLSRIQGIKKVAPDMDIFFDVLSLRSGDDWEKKLNQHVPTKDIFYLFWSKSAANSKWVEREWKMALEKRGLNYIDPVPLDPPDLAPPPKELGTLHFNDAYLGHIKYEELKKDI